MKRIYELDENDIIQVLANYYNCDVKNVVLTVEPVTVIEGPGEHIEYHPVAIIRVKANNQR